MSGLLGRPPTTISAPRSPRRLVGSEPHHADADSPLDETDERLLKEVGKPLGCALLALRLLQLLPDSPHIAGHARDGGEDHGSRVGYRRDSLILAVPRIKCMFFNSLARKAACDVLNLY